MTTYRFTDADGDGLLIQPREAHVDAPEAHVAAHAGVFIPKDEAPAVALAILEAAGWKAGPTGVHYAAHILKGAVEQRERVKALEEQKARFDAEALDREALALLNAASGEHFEAFPTAPNVADFWRNAARKARELHAAK